LLTEADNDKSSWCSSKPAFKISTALTSSKMIYVQGIMKKRNSNFKVGNRVHLHSRSWKKLHDSD
jgi:hypothetical protein